MIGQIISHYRIEKKLGAGGMGEVYLAYDQNLDRFVALKILPQEFVSETERLRRFIREAKAASQINHPNVAHIYDIGEDQGTHFIAMEFIEGESLQARMTRNSISADEIIRIANQALEALEEAHKKGIIHRDIKPANIMMAGSGRLKLVDFGLAKFRQTETDLSSRLSTASQTDLGVIMGTLPYMSPEQLLGRSIDQRSDFFSLGVVLYQIAARKLPFQGNTAPELADAILHNQPASLVDQNSELPGDLNKIITRMLAKDPADRPATAHDILSDLEKLRRDQQPAASVWNTIRRPLVMIPVALILLVIAASGYWLFQRNKKIKWASENAVLQIAKLVDQGNFQAAVQLGTEAERYIPNDPLLKTLWSGMSITLSIQTDPADAEVFIKDYASTDENWKAIGKTPLQKLRMPKGYYRLKISKSGYPELLAVAPRGFWEQNVNLNYSLNDSKAIPKKMARIPGMKSDPNSTSDLETVPVEQDYWMDQYEVTNEEYQKFVESGGYQDRKYWNVPVMQDGKELSFDDAMKLFQDATGRPGPLEWEVGKYPRDQGAAPVTGVSWYEAAAYAEFSGKQLPSIHHWYHAAGSDMNEQIIPFSNFSGRGFHAAGNQRSMSPFGTFDMAGNVKEWCWNEAAGEKRTILGGSFLEPAYMFLELNVRSPMTRENTLGFRCVKYLSPGISPAYKSPHISSRRDYTKEKPVTDEVFAVLKTFYDYPKRDLHSKVESKQEQSYMIKEMVTFDAAYGKERMIAYLFLPKRASPPFQTVIYFPGSGAQYFSESETLLNVDYSDYGDFLIRSGRAFIYPVYKGTYERGGGPDSRKRTPEQSREWKIQYVKDFRRVVDYLETRAEIDRKKLVYFGSSFGGRVGNIIGAVEPRLSVMIMEHAGFSKRPRDPESDEINFAPHIRIPVLMINGSFDHVYPIETSQKPMFATLGTPTQDKRHFVFEGGHITPRKEIIRVVLDWLDRYLGPLA